MSRRFSAVGDDTGRREPRRTIATYDDYRDAERAVDSLADRRFPVERVSIAGRDLKFVEQVTGRMTFARAALHGAISGALAGVLIGWLFTLFNWSDPVVSRGWLILDGLWFGALVGLLYGLLAHALTGGRRDFTSAGGVQADRYDVLVDDDVADEAARLLGTLPQSVDRHDPRFARDPDGTPATTAATPRGDRSQP